MAAIKPVHPPTASTFARVGVIAYGLLIVYASLYPFSGWRNNGIGAFAYLSAPLPHYWTLFDVITNIIGYAPLGLLAVCACYPRLRGAWAALPALAGCVLLSAAMEATQTFLPSRVSSNVDFVTNSAGALAGIIAGVLLTPIFLEKSRFLQLRHGWFLKNAGRGLIVLGLWLLAQIYPQPYLFGHGQIAPVLSDWLSSLLSVPVDLAAMLRNNVELSPEQYWLSEAVMTASGLTGSMLILLMLLKPRAPKVVLTLLLLSLALTAKALASALFFSPDNAFVWLTPGAQGGLLFGCMMLFGLAFAPTGAQRRMAILMFLISLLIVNAVPANPYFTATLQTWVQGKFLNFNGAAHFLSLLWPFLALWLLLYPIDRLKQQ